MSSSVARKVIGIAALLHDRMMQLSAIARNNGQYELAQQIEDCKLDLANQITVVVLELQLEAMGALDALELGK